MMVFALALALVLVLVTVIVVVPPEDVDVDDYQTLPGGSSGQDYVRPASSTLIIRASSRSERQVFEDVVYETDLAACQDCLLPTTCGSRGIRLDN